MMAYVIRTHLVGFRILLHLGDRHPALVIGVDVEDLSNVSLEPLDEKWLMSAHLGVCETGVLVRVQVHEVALLAGEGGAVTAVMLERVPLSDEEPLKVGGHAGVGIDWSE